MKKSLSLIAVYLLTITFVFAQDSPYQKAMKKEIARVIVADSISQLQQSANAFSRIAELNTKEWQPLYYGALAYTYQGLNGSLTLDQKDAALAKADELANKAEVLSPDNAEIITLKGFILMAKVSADPGSRGASLSGQVMSTYGKALSIDGKNPRALSLLAQMEFGMAQFFNNGTDKACGLAKQSMAVFAGQDEEALKAQMLPTWGKGMT